MKKGKNQKGFTLIELMITVAIVGILAAIAFPAYQDYIIKTQVAEGFSLASAAKVNIVEYAEYKGQLPPGATEVGYGGATGKYVSGVDISNGRIIVTFSSIAPQSSNPKLNEATLILNPTQNATTGGLIWDCTLSIGKRYAPSTCN